MSGVDPDDVDRLEIALQKLVLEPRGGLTALCNLNADMVRTLVSPMVEQTTAFLGDLLPITDVTEVETSAAKAKKVDLTTRVQEYHRRAAPAAGAPDAEEQTFVLVPDSDQGKVFASLVKKTIPNALMVPVNGSATDYVLPRTRLPENRRTGRAAVQLPAGILPIAPIPLIACTHDSM